jgi:hypothetical protein
MSDRSPSALEHALRAEQTGICVIPPREDGSKRPLVDWEEWQGKRPNADQLRAWYRHRRSGVGFVCGKVSGNLELFDFDDRAAYERFKDVALKNGLGALVEQIEAGYLEVTPNNGVHWLYRCQEVSGNTKLARRPKEPDEMRDASDKIKVLIETRGEGGYVVVAPSNARVHPTRKAYQLLRGAVESIAEITPDEREALWSLARTLDRMPRLAFKEPVPLISPQNGTTQGVRPGDDFNARATWSEILEPHGWVWVEDHGEESFWRRPGSDNRWSATTNYKGSDLLYVFTTSTIFDPERSYSKFVAYTLLNHNVDFSEAARALVTKGYGDQSTRPEIHLEIPKNGLHDKSDDSATATESPSATPDPYPTQSLAELLAARFETEIAYLVRGILRRGKTHWLYASPGVGKTLLGLALGMHIAAGKNFCGRSVGQGAVVYFGEDSPLQGIAEYADMLAAAHDIPVSGLPFYLNCERGFRLNSAEALHTATVVVLRHNPMLVILDSAERLVPSEKFNSAEIDYLVRFVAWLTDQQITVIVIDHTNKKFAMLKPEDAKSIDMLEALYGGRAKSAMADVGMFMSGTFKNNSSVRLQWTKERGEPTDPVDFKFDSVAGFRLIAAKKRAKTENERKVLAWFNNNGHTIGFYSRVLICNAVGIGERTSERLFKNMVNNELLIGQEEPAPHGGRWMVYALNTTMVGGVFD